ncbi:hypothetical protein TEQG_05978 [Trichophyton equinum CBS 127.97]|uniref:HNH nuclease domain-containing protein n=1 Tax=Trichophyton equinum (strain ATCC MYA-4606 / CBS 127.97) TaxID=559882 RepID=F2PYF7_TRIEC|nr:hypothetical protein TEQG_05978 [Trichophyton equinum CBS 127.97]
MAQNRHQASLEGLLDFSAPEALAASQRAQAARTFHMIVDYFRQEEVAAGSSPKYSRFLLVRYTYNFSLSELSQDIFLRAFFESMNFNIAVGYDPDFTKDADSLRQGVVAFADFLFDNFFLPLRASSKHTPQPSPAHLSVIQRVQGPHENIPTLERLSSLRRACLVRDRSRCVISSTFDATEAVARLREDGDNAKDDNGDHLMGELFESLEVAHILPHSLTQANDCGELSDSKKAALKILNMFDINVSHLIDGVNIDRAYNAITLTHTIRRYFGDFLVFFTSVSGQEHTYKIESFLPKGVVPALPVTRALYLTEDRSIDPPSPRLLAIHRAISHILHLSGAGAAIDKILKDMDDIGTSAAGTTALGQIVALKLGGWVSGELKCTIKATCIAKSVPLNSAN